MNTAVPLATARESSVRLTLAICTALVADVVWYVCPENAASRVALVADVVWNVREKTVSKAAQQETASSSAQETY